MFDNCKGQNLESEVLPNLVESGQLYNYQHGGFWKSMDTSKDQQDLERLFEEGTASWTVELSESGTR